MSKKLDSKYWNVKYMSLLSTTETYCLYIEFKGNRNVIFVCLPLRIDQQGHCDQGTDFCWRPTNSLAMASPENRRRSRIGLVKSLSLSSKVEDTDLPRGEAVEEDEVTKLSKKIDQTQKEVALKHEEFSTTLNEFRNKREVLKEQLQRIKQEKAVLQQTHQQERKMLLQTIEGWKVVIF